MNRITANGSNVHAPERYGRFSLAQVRGRAFREQEEEEAEEAALPLYHRCVCTHIRVLNYEVMGTVENV
jgi:hypothetical protein